MYQEFLLQATKKEIIYRQMYEKQNDVIAHFLE